MTRVTAEGIYDLYKGGRINIEELKDLLNDSEIERLHNKGIISDYEYRRLGHSIVSSSRLLRIIVKQSYRHVHVGIFNDVSQK